VNVCFARKAEVQTYGSAPEVMPDSAPRLQAVISDGVVALDGTSLAVKDNSRFRVRGVAATFDAHLDASKQLHSRAVQPGAWSQIELVWLRLAHVRHAPIATKFCRAAKWRDVPQGDWRTIVA
jgi:hypothetical protein